MKIFQKKIIVIVGPNASGKSAMAAKLALWLKGSQKKFGIKGAEIISADSRQVYKGMDIGTGKITKKEMSGMAHHLLDVVNPKKRFTVSQYRKLALLAIKNIFQKEKIPIFCGGAGFYLQAVIDGIYIPEVPPDWQLRKRLEKKSVMQLYKMLKRLDPSRAKTIERKNLRRLVRALEIVIKTKKPVPEFKKSPLPYAVIFLGIKKPKEELKRRIKIRLLKRLKKGMVVEVKRLKKFGLSWKKLEDFGLEYRYVAHYLQKKLSYCEMVEKLEKAIWQYARRQMVWFKKEKRIHWVKDFKEAKELTGKFLK